MIAGRVDVAVIDPEGPPGVATIRSLGRRGVPVDVYGVNRWAPGRFSKYLRAQEICPSPHDTDRFVAWLAAEMEAGNIAHVAPTSDYVAFGAAVAADRAGRPVLPGTPSLRAVWTCLHKGEFGAAVEAAGYPTVPYRLPTSLDDALAAADELGYPVLLKPRSHVGIGFFRGAVANSPAELREAFVPLLVGDGHSVATDLDPDLQWPIVQRFANSASVDVVSVSGCLDRNGAVVALGLCRKMSQWPPDVGIGSLFESVEDEDFVDRAVDAVRATIGVGLFEIEVLVDRSTGESWPIDLNPRAFGQISLEVARGNDLPARWYEVVTGIRLRDDADRLATEPPEVWRAGLTYFPGMLAGILLGPGRRQRLRNERALLRRRRVGSVFDRRDPKPAFALAAHLLQNPSGLIRPFVRRD